MDGVDDELRRLRYRESRPSIDVWKGGTGFEPFCPVSGFSRGPGGPRGDRSIGRRGASGFPSRRLSLELGTCCFEDPLPEELPPLSEVFVESQEVESKGKSGACSRPEGALKVVSVAPSPPLWTDLKESLDVLDTLDVIEGRFDDGRSASCEVSQGCTRILCSQTC